MMYCCFPKCCLPVVAVLTIVTLSGCNGLSDIVDKANAKAINSSTDEEVLDMFRKTDRMCPVKVDVITTLESVKVLDERNIEYRYTISGFGKKLLSNVSSDAAKRNMLRAMKGNEVAVAIAERDLSCSHIYEDANGGHIMAFTINREVLAGNMNPTGQPTGNPFATPVKAKSKTHSNSLPRSSSTGTKNPAGVTGNPYFNG